MPVRPMRINVEAARVSPRLLGELLIEEGLITSEELEEALEAQTACGKQLGEILVERKLVSGPELTAILMKQVGVEVTTQEGFGAGLWAEIRRRHRDGRAATRGSETSNYIRLEPTKPQAGDLVALDLSRTDGSGPAAQTDTDSRHLEPDTVATEGEIGAQEVFDPELVATDADGQPRAERDSPEEPAAQYVVFAPGAVGYEISAHTGVPPALGAIREMNGRELRVVKIGCSPLPEDRRCCVFLAA